jgi:peptidoglycan/xylan/chitin deacetylase (PgdA/CDA1 family)
MEVVTGPPKPIQWPGQAQICVSVTCAFEAYEFAGHFNSGNKKPGQKHALSLSFADYAYKVGVWRLMDCFDRYGIKATFDLNGKAAQEQPVIAREMAKRGHETAAHGWVNDHFPDEGDPDRELKDIRRTVEAIQAATGERPIGWVGPGNQGTSRTLEHMVDEGFLWNADDASDDLPFVRIVKGKKIVVIPRTSYATNDLVCWLRPVNSPNVYFEGFKATFDYLYREGARGNPKWVEMILHCDIGSRPALMNSVEQALDYAKGHQSVWVARRRDVAQWILENRP